MAVEDESGTCEVYVIERSSIPARGDAARDCVAGAKFQPQVDFDRLARSLDRCELPRCSSSPSSPPARRRRRQRPAARQCHPPRCRLP